MFRVIISDNPFTLMVEDIEKGAGHKYVKRELTGKISPKYRYWYNIPGKGLVSSDGVQVGAKYAHGAGEEKGHYHVDSVDHENQSVTVTHDETGKKHTMSHDDFRDMIHGFHGVEEKKKAIKKEISEAAKAGDLDHAEKLVEELKGITGKESKPAGNQTVFEKESKPPLPAPYSPKPPESVSSVSTQAPVPLTGKAKSNLMAMDPYAEKLGELLIRENIYGFGEDDSPGAIDHLFGEGESLATGEVESIRSLHDTLRKALGFEQIDPKNVEERKAALQKKYGPSAFFHSEHAYQGWSESSNPFEFGGLLSLGRHMRFLSLALGNTSLDDEDKILDKFYYQSTPPKREKFRSDYEKTMTPGTVENKALQVLLGQQLIWADYMRETTGKDTISFMRGLEVGDPPGFIKNAKTNGFATSSAASCSESISIVKEFVGDKGVIVYFDNVPLEHCLGGWQTHSNIGIQNKNEHEKEIIVGNIRNANVRFEESYLD